VKTVTNGRATNAPALPHGGTSMRRPRLSAGVATNTSNAVVATNSEPQQGTQKRTQWQVDRCHGEHVGVGRFISMASVYTRQNITLTLLKHTGDCGANAHSDRNARL
jgi:hypothetical protein